MRRGGCSEAVGVGGRQPACKPGSVRHAAKPHARWPFLWGEPLPAASSNQPGRDPETDSRHLASAACAPIRSCSRWGLPCRVCCQPRGALLPHRFTLAVGTAGGGLLSVALSLGLPPPDVIRHRVSVEPGLSSAGCGGHPADWPSGHKDFRFDRQSSRRPCRSPRSRK